MKVSVILQKMPARDVQTIAPEASVDDAIRNLAANRIGALVVTSGDGRVGGIISERDIVRLMGTVGSAALETPVSEAMTRKVQCCTADDTAFDVLGRMTEGRFRHMPVLGADGRMTGILSIGDVVKARLEEIEAENAAMVDMLSS